MLNPQDKETKTNGCSDDGFCKDGLIRQISSKDKNAVVGFRLWTRVDLRIKTNYADVCTL